MKRLTEKKNGRNVISLSTGNQSKWELTGLGKDKVRFLYGECADKLAAYEDIGLTPEQIQELIDNSLDAIEMCKIKIALDKLKEYQELEKQGLLYRKVYYVDTECSHPSDCDGVCEYCDSNKLEVKSDIIRLRDIESSKYFLTEEDAMQALHNFVK
jgi:hypothetical protein